MLDTSKATTPALLNAAKSLQDEGKYAESKAYVMEALRRNGDDVAALTLLAEITLTEDNRGGAVILYMKAICLNPAELAYKERFFELAGNAQITQYALLTDHAILECLKSAAILNCQPMSMLWFTHIMSHPDFHAAFHLADRRRFDPANKAHFEGLSHFKPLFTPCFLLGLKNIIVYSVLFEEFVTHIRKHLLEDRNRDKKRFTPEESVILADALAHYSFFTDYILECTEEEQNKVDALRRSIETDDKTVEDAASIALYACYEPLFRLKNAARVEAVFSASSVIADIVGMQIGDHKRLLETAASVTAITRIDDSISAKVQEQYEEFPYPRWKSFSVANLLRDWKTYDVNGAVEGRLRSRKIKILIAGCGTGREPIAIAPLFPLADILAVDLSRSGLAYAIHKAQEYNIGNVTFRQADILHLGEIGQTFDYIVSVGVLHHMRDPIKGWQILCGLLKPGGIMRIGLYSKIARAVVIEAQEIIKQGGYASDVEGMKTVRRNGLQVLGRPILEEIITFDDYYHLNMYRDLLLQVQETDYDLLEIDNIIRNLKLEFVSFFTHPSVLAEYGRLYPHDPQKTNLANWDLLERKHPALFREMYFFWCRKRA